MLESCKIISGMIQMNKELYSAFLIIQELWEIIWDRCKTNRRKEGGALVLSRHSVAEMVSVNLFQKQLVRQCGGRCDSRSGLLWNWLLEEKRICCRSEWLCWVKKGSSSPAVHSTQCCQKDPTKEHVQRNFSCDSLFLLLLGSLRNINIKGECLVCR